MPHKPKERARQLKVLGELRTRQQEFLIESGIARRIVIADSSARSDPTASGEFTERTLLFPTRQALGGMAIAKLTGGLDSLSERGSNLPQSSEAWNQFVGVNPTADVVLVGRVDVSVDGGWRERQFQTGIQLVRGIPEAGGISLDLVLPEDLSALMRLLKEVEDTRFDKAVTCIDQEKLINLTIPSTGPLPRP